MRIGGFFLVAPFASENNIPMQVKIIFTLTFSFVIFMTIPNIEGFFSFLTLIFAIKEFLLGLLIGFGIKIVWSMLETAGQIIGQQGGFALASFFDPVSMSQSNVISKFLNTTIFLVFLSANGHLIIYKTAIESFTLFPLGMDVTQLFQFRVIPIYFAELFTIAVRLSAPVLVSSLLVYTALGIMAKVAPQMNLFMMSFPITLIATVFIFHLSLNGIAHTALFTLDNYLQRILVDLRFLN
jgi:flagellar biosynthetic protein FliR